MRILHLSDRASDRGGADWQLSGWLELLGRDCEQLLAVGRDELAGTAACPVQVVPGLDAAAEVSVAESLTELVADFRPRVIHLHNVVNPLALEWAASHSAAMTVHDHRCFCPGRGKLTATGQVCREPLAATTCEPCFDDTRYFRELLTRTERRLAAVRSMAALTVTSSYMRQELISAGVDAPIHVVPPVLRDLSLAVAPAGPRCVLFAGRLVAAKGIWDAVEAWRRSAVELPLVFAGTGTERGALERAGFEVLGWLPHSEMSAVYRRASVVVVPSRWQEPFGIVGPEALALGVPVVAWDSGGVREWCAEPVAWGDVEALAGAIAQAVAHRSELPAAEAPGPAARYRPVAVVAALRRFYEEAVSAASWSPRGTVT